MSFEWWDLISVQSSVKYYVIAFVESYVIVGDLLFIELISNQIAS